LKSKFRIINKILKSCKPTNPIINYWNVKGGKRHYKDKIRRIPGGRVRVDLAIKISQHIKRKISNLSEVHYIRESFVWTRKGNTRGGIVVHLFRPFVRSKRLNKSH
jgi:hypothetical protein